MEIELTTPEINLSNLFNSPSKYREHIIRNYYCYKFPNKSEKAINERFEEDILKAIFEKMVPYDYTSPEQLKSSLIEILKEIR